MTDSTTKYLFFTGKGGKTSLASKEMADPRAAATELAH
jgi:hypothetical protein